MSVKAGQAQAPQEATLFGVSFRLEHVIAMQCGEDERLVAIEASDDLLVHKVT
jgi:hypothetical protein